MPDDLAGWLINEHGDIICPDHQDGFDPLITGRDQAQSFPPPDPNARVHSKG